MARLSSATFGRESLETPLPAAGTLSDVHNPAAGVDFRRAVRRTDTTADHATPSLTFSGKCGDGARSLGTSSRGLF